MQKREDASYIGCNAKQKIISKFNYDNDAKIHRTNLRFVGERMKIINGLKVKEKKYSGVLMILILSFLLHLIPIFIVKTPTSGPDEVISLASAAKLAGYDWSYLVTKFGTKYGCGSAWYLAPLFYFITNGKIIYNLARTVLAFILALQSVVCWLILKKFLNMIMNLK